MRLEYSNLRYYNYEESNVENYKSFNLDIKDLDGEILDGNTFPFTFVVSDDPKYNTSEIAQQVLKDYKDGNINLDDIQPYEDPTPIETMRFNKQQEISNFKNNLLNTGSVMYKDDLFDIDDKALLRISGVIQAYTFQIQAGILTADQIVQPWISQTKAKHNLSFSELVELSMLMMKEVQTIVLRGNYLCQEVLPAIQDKKELCLLDWYYEDNNTNE